MSDNQSNFSSGFSQVLGMGFGFLFLVITIPIVLFVGCSACAAIMIGIGEAEMEGAQNIGLEITKPTEMLFTGVSAPRDTYAYIEMDYDNLELGRREGHEDYHKTPPQNAPSQRCVAIIKKMRLDPKKYVCD